VIAGDEAPFMLLLRGDHDLNEVKTGKLFANRNGYRLAREEEIQRHLGEVRGYMGPVNARQRGISVVADRTVAALSDFICGANQPGFHLTGVNFGRDLPEPDLVADIRNVERGDPSPDGKGMLEICRGIEVGHVFQLRTKYSAAMNVTYLDENGRSVFAEMGCYGIGVSRIVAAAIEQNFDERGIIFPQPIAPFHLSIIPIGFGKSRAVAQTAEDLHTRLTARRIEVLLDDREERPGVMFADHELIGIPHRIVVSERGLNQGGVEYQARRDSSGMNVPLQNAINFIESRIWEEERSVGEGS
jgi:prolyl-tRNA synthetase